MPLQSVDRAVELAALAKAAALVAGAVAGASAGWMSKRNLILAFCACLVGIIGGLWLGALAGRAFVGLGDNGMVKASVSSIGYAVAAGLAGALPTAFLVGGMITFLALRHVRQRPPPYRTGFKAFGYGLAAGVLAAVGWMLV